MGNLVEEIFAQTQLTLKSHDLYLGDLYYLGGAYFLNIIYSCVYLFGCIIRPMVAWAPQSRHTGLVAPAHGIFISRSGIESASPALEGGFLPTGPLGKSWGCLL